MELETLNFEGTWEEIAAQAPRFPGRRLRLTILPKERPGTLRAEGLHSLEEKLAEIAAEVPDAEWAGLPADLGDQLDHYVYGTPKRG